MGGVQASQINFAALLSAPNSELPLGKAAAQQPAFGGSLWNTPLPSDLMHADTVQPQLSMQPQHPSGGQQHFTPLASGLHQDAYRSQGPSSAQTIWSNHVLSADERRWFA